MNRTLTAASGAAFPLLMVVAFGQVSTPDSKDPAATITAYYADSGHRTHLIVAEVLVCLAAVAWVVFTASMRTRMTSPTARGIVPAAAGATAALLGVIATLLGSVALEVTGEHAPVPPADLVRYLPNIGYYGMTFLAMPLAGLVVAAVCADAYRSGWLPRWLCWFGFVAAVGQLAAMIFFPMFLLFLWVLVTAIVVGVRRTAAAPAAAPATA